MNQGSSSLVGVIIDGRYRLVRMLGQGGMAEVYEAEHTTLGTSFALKIAGAEIAGDVELARRFENEARVAARIKSDHVVRVVDVGVWGDRPYMVMDLLEGEDLEQLAARKGRLSVSEAVDYVIEALAALHDVHAAGIVHRDLKPSNLFLHAKPGAAPVVKLVDFGVATTGLVGKTRVTTTGSTLGSPAYMSPEQLRSAKHVDGRADLWSIGVILYELVTGEMPFFGDNVGAVFAAILETDAPPPSTRSAGIPMGLDEIVLRCLRRKPEERWPTAAALVAALAPWASDAGRALADRVGAVPSLPIDAVISRPSYPRPLIDSISSVPPAARTLPPGEKRSGARWSDSVAPRPKRRAVAIGAVAASIALVLGGVAVWKRAAIPATSASASSLPSAPPSETAVRVDPAPVATAPAVDPTPAVAAADAGAVPAARPAPRPAARPQPTAKRAPTAVDEDRIFGRH